MKLKSVEIKNYRAIEHLRLPLDPSLTVLHGDNTCGKTSVLSATAIGLGAIPELLPDSWGIDFLETDLRLGESFMQVNLMTIDGLAWRRERERVTGADPQEQPVGIRGLASLKGRLDGLARADREESGPVTLPIIAYYNTDRAVLGLAERDVPDRLRPYVEQAAHEELRVGSRRRRGSPRYSALEGALAARANFPQLFRWFRAKEDEELREQKRQRDFDYSHKDLSAVRSAISSMLDGVSEPRIDVRPLRFAISVTPKDGQVETLEIDQLSDGQRAVLALAADLAWRMAQGNPHLDDPLMSEAIVLIDEVELHLHPSWQQRVLIDLRRTFPNAQFIVSTHSPQLLTTVEPKHIVELAREDGRIVAGSVAGWTYGAESGDVLSVVMGVDERPVNDFTDALARYRRLVSEGQGDSEEAVALRATLERLSPDDPALARADLEIRQRRLFEEMAKPR